MDEIDKDAANVFRLDADLIGEITRRFNQDQAGWAWLNELSPIHLRRIGAAAYSRFVEQPVKESIERLEQDSIKLTEISQPYLRWDSPEGRLIEKIRKEGLVEIALFVFLLITPMRREMCNALPDLAFIFSPGRYEYERSTAYGIINRYYDLDTLAEDGARESLYVAATAFQAEMSKLTFEAHHRLDELSAISEHAGDLFKRDIQSIRRGLKRRRRAWSNVVRDTVRNSKEKLFAATAHLDSAKEAYSAQIDLKASVEYWNERRASHERSRTRSMWAVGSSMLATLLAMFCYFRFVVASGSAEVVDKVANASADKAATLSAAISTQAITDLVTHLFGAALVLTFMGIIVRMALRQYNIHSNCALEAQERVTFTKTYLALMHEGKLTAEADRKLVLESLFRPNSFSNSQEITFSTPMEMIYKAAEKARS